jgi:hypothetical protein
MFCNEHEPLALLVELTPKLAKKRFRQSIYEPGITNADIVVTRRQALITSCQGLSRALLIDII